MSEGQRLIQWSLTFKLDRCLLEILTKGAFVKCNQNTLCSGMDKLHNHFNVLLSTNDFDLDLCIHI